MPSEPNAASVDVGRLHPLSLLFSIGTQAKNLLLPGIVVLVFASRGGRGELWFMLLFIPAVVAALVRYLTYRYRFDSEELVVREGIVFRNERHIPYVRIQNIDLVQNPLHRMFGVAEVRVETAGGARPEAVMRVLSLDAVERMRRRVFAGDRGREQAAATPNDTLYSMSLRDVVLFGLLSNKGMVVVAAALGAAWQLDLFETWWESLSQDSWEAYRAMLPDRSRSSIALLVTAAVLAAIVVMRLLSVIWAVAKFHGFRLGRLGEDLRTDFGLLPRVSKSVPRHRIQVLSTREGVVQRYLGRQSVEVETAGSSGEGDLPSSDRVWLAPLAPRGRVDALIRDALPEVDLENLHWLSLSDRAFRRRLRVSLILTVMAGAVAVGFAGPWGLVLPLVLVPISWLGARLYVRYTSYALASGAVLFRCGWMTRRLSIARFSKIQSVHLGESPLDRRHGMASVRVDTAGATRGGHSIDIPYLDAGVARTLQGTLYEAAGRTAFRW